MNTPQRPRVPQPWPIRLSHWANVPLLAIMAGSGLQILVAYPFLGPRGRLDRLWPFQGQPPPASLRLGEWLGGARHWHFAFAWLFLANAVFYALFVTLSGRWRERYFWPRRDTRNAMESVLGYLRIRKAPAPHGFYNGLQRAAYTGAIVLGLAELLSGLALWKPIQLHPLAMLFGGYDGARVVHLLGLIALAAFAIGHVVMVLSHPKTLGEMITGGRPR